MQSPTGLTIIGLLIVACTVALLIRGKMQPIIAMTIIPVIGAFIAGHGLSDIGEFYASGLDSVMNVVVMFIFAIVFFGILQDVGLFTPIVTTLIKATRGQPMLVALGTAAIGVVAHLDGAGATTFLLTIPALLPLYRAMHMSRYVLLAIVSIAAAVMNMVPWGGPVGRAASVITQEPNDIWVHILPIQGVALVLVFVTAALLGFKEQRRIAGLRASGELDEGRRVDVAAIAYEFKERPAAEAAESGLNLRTGRWVTAINVVLIIAVIAVMVSDLLPPGPAFLIATTIALLVNFPLADDQSSVLKRHAPAALSMAGVILAAAMFLGVLNESGMLEQIALSLLSVLPDSVGPWLHVIVGVLGVPLDLLTSTDAYYFSVLPIVEQTAQSFGVSGMGAASALIIGNVIGTFVSPFSPALWLGIGLAQANMGRHIRFTFPLAWAFAAVLVLIAVPMGLLA